MPTLTLTEQQELAVINAARPLAPIEQKAFLMALYYILHGLLANRSEVGDGELSRLLRELQRKHFRPPA
jgi:recombinational DNA repair protein RecR